MNYLCAAIDRHFNHEEEYGKGAIFSLESHQHGWDAFSQVRVGDTLYLIAPNRIVKQAYRVMRVRRGEDHVVAYSDQVVDDPRIPYQTFIKRHGLSDSRISSIGNMLRGFNVVAFDGGPGTKKPRGAGL
ncbi:MAG: hypothetical protein R3179_01585 [Sedimenticolaceae bacterium]|nr:hypothetical protein [Sedimenticolaceae bacterium]